MENNQCIFGATFERRHHKPVKLHPVIDLHFNREYGGYEPADSVGDLSAVKKEFGDIWPSKFVIFMTDTLRKVGMPEKLLTYMIAQVVHESNWGRSSLAHDYNNYSGIRCNNHGLTNGCRDKNGNFPNSTAGFATYEDPIKWASDYKRVLSLSPARPIDAKNVQDFFNRLLKNGYFTAAESKSYTTAYNARLRQVNEVLKDESGDLNAAVKDADPHYVTKVSDKQGIPAGGGLNWWDKQPWYAKGGIIAGGGLLLLMVVRR